MLEKIDNSLLGFFQKRIDALQYKGINAAKLFYHLGFLSCVLQVLHRVINIKISVDQSGVNDKVSTEALILLLTLVFTLSIVKAYYNIARDVEKMEDCGLVKSHFWGGEKCRGLRIMQIIFIAPIPIEIANSCVKIIHHGMNLDVLDDFIIFTDATLTASLIIALGCSYSKPRPPRQKYAKEVFA